ncbi:Gfo/Idh/MocA family protein [Thaumasiovibrio sp. DFM-14]|uniref:Gfo/Idh/MocA family protein n=1 Tax=Thaumasiovibrio sp. DFM-14 TaxID=3384792 RepID=UPI0039A39194
MLKLAIIGTNWITEKFVEAAQNSAKFQLVMVYSRNMASAQDFASKFSVTQVVTDLKTLAQCDEVDAVYIASPNSLHCEQAIQMMQSGKHVICEKPLASNITEAQRMYEVARENQVILFEAFKTDYLPNFKLIREMLPKLGQLRQVFFSYCQYSSRYQRYLDGENPNTFNPAFSNGSIMDIGYYCVASAAALFGRPEQIQATARLLDSGVDGHGTVQLHYADFDVVILHSKVSHSSIPTEIQGEDGALLISKISEGEKVLYQPRDGQVEDITLPQRDNSMEYEAEHFYQQIQQQQMDAKAIERSLLTAEMLTEIRQQTGVVFPADQ